MQLVKFLQYSVLVVASKVQGKNAWEDLNKSKRVFLQVLSGGNGNMFLFNGRESGELGNPTDLTKILEHAKYVAHSVD